MLSLRNAAQGHVSAGQPIDVLALAAALPCPISSPVSVTKLIAELQQDSFIFPVWNFGGGYFTGWTQLGLCADGTGSYRGHAHDSGPVDYDYTVATVLLDVKDQSGNNLAFVHSGTVHGTVEAWASRDDNWQTDSLSCVVADNWSAVQTSRTWSHILNTQIDPVGVIAAVLEAIPIALGVTGLALFGGGIASTNWTCQWMPAEQGGGLKCEGN